MRDQASRITMIMGGIDRSAEFRRETGSGRRSTAALVVVIAALMAATVWLAGAILPQPVAAVAAAAAETAPAAPNYP